MRRLVFAALLVSFVGTASLSADEAAALRPSQRKMAIEKILDAPLAWDIGDREQVTLAELIHHVHEQHRLQIRWDAVSLGLIYGDQSPLGELLRTPLGLRAYYSPNQCPTGDLATCPGTSQPIVNSGQTQEQPFNPSASPSLPAVAGTPSYPVYGNAVPYPTQASQSPAANNRIDAPVPGRAPTGPTCPWQRSATTGRESGSRQSGSAPYAWRVPRGPNCP